MEWFRFYHEAVNDPKVQRLPPPLFKHWVNIMCIASMHQDRGVLPALSDVAFTLRLSTGKVKGIIGELEQSGLIDRDGETLRIHAWSKRQKRSDDVSPRVAKHRTGNVTGNVTDGQSVTLQPTQDATLPHVRVTETETEQKQNRTETPPMSPPDENGSAGARLSIVQPKPWDVLEVVCEALGTSTADLSESDKGRQLASAKRLLQDGATLDDIGRITAWLRRQNWVTAGVDLPLIEKQIGRWRLNGKPDAPSTVPNGVHLPPHLQQRVDRWVMERQTLKQPIEPYPDGLMADIEAWRASRSIGVLA